jgi:arginyl-tRNA synthetase
VFINSKGFPTYEAKELALAEKHFADYNPDKVIHVVGKEQTEYFKVFFKALEQVMPESIGREYHLIGGFLQLKGDQKMSSRKGNIVTGDQLLEEVTERVEKIMADSSREKKMDSAEVMERVAIAALKYGMLKNNVSQDVAFDLEESLSVTGDSGPYLLYLVARIKSILRKADGSTSAYVVPQECAPEEKNLLLKMAQFPVVTLEAVETYDPSKISRYLFELAQRFTSFYEACPVLKADEAMRNYRLALLTHVLQVMEKGLGLLGVETVEEM